MSDTYEAFYNGKPLNPNRGLPTMSYAQAEDCGLTDSERLWCRTDGDGTVITADEVPYDSNNSVGDMLTPVDVMSKLTLNTDYFSDNGNGLLLKIGNLVYISMGINIKQATSGGLNPVFTVTSDIKPKQGSRLIMFGQGNSAIRMVCDASQTSGFRTIGNNPSVTANTEIYISGVWVIDN